MDVRTSRRALLTGAAGAGLVACSSSDHSSSTPAPSAVTSSPATPGPATPTVATSASGTPTPLDPQVAGEVVTGLAVPWGIAFLPDQTALVGERDTGRLLRVTAGHAGHVGTFDVFSRLDEGGETGLLGLALHPEFETNRLLYAYVSTAEDNRVVRTTYDGGLGDIEPLLTGIATSTHHNGGDLLFGVDGLLYVSTGDAEDESTPQDTSSLNGKILRLTPDGAAAPGNPFDNEVWTYGHRNVEGLCFDEAGLIWAAEFGDKGADELNRIRKGHDYGWPDVEGSDGKGGYTDPLAQWPVDQCSPSGVAVTGGIAWLGALQGECVWSVVLYGPDPAPGTTQQYFTGDYGRIRRVRLAPDGSLWVTTSNRDGRADPRPGDDRILRVTL